MGTLQGIEIWDMEGAPWILRPICAISAGRRIKTPNGSTENVVRHRALNWELSPQKAALSDGKGIRAKSWR